MFETVMVNEDCLKSLVEVLLRPSKTPSQIERRLQSLSVAQLRTISNAARRLHDACESALL